jgi:hypothetical protein
MDVKGTFGGKHPRDAFGDHARGRQWDNMARHNHAGVACGAVVLQVCAVDECHFESFFLKEIGSE